MPKKCFQNEERHPREEPQKFSTSDKKLYLGVCVFRSLDILGLCRIAVRIKVSTNRNQFDGRLLKVHFRKCSKHAFLNVIEMNLSHCITRGPCFVVSFARNSLEGASAKMRNLVKKMAESIRIGRDRKRETEIDIWD